MSRQSHKGRQQYLFGEPESQTRRGSVGPAPVPEDLQRIAAALPRNIYLGTSSWSFPGWVGLVYDREVGKGLLARQGLAAYAQHPLLRTVGIDRTFYAALPAETFAAYASDVPDDFRFLVKAPAQLTSYRVHDAAIGGATERSPHFLDVAFAVDAVVRPYIEGLGSKGGALVFQFPPVGRELRSDPPRFAGMLGEFLAALPRGPVYAVEVRDRELVCRDTFAALAAGGARYCLSLHPRMPPIADQVPEDFPDDGPMVGRWMLHGSQSYEAALERYGPFTRLVDEDPHSRERLADRCLEQALRGRDVIVTANNKAEGSAPLTVFKLAETIVRKLRERDDR